MNKSLTEQQISEVANDNKLKLNVLKAVLKVESAGSGFRGDGQLQALLEGHLVWKRLKSRQIDPGAIAAGCPLVCQPTWAQARVHYQTDTYRRFQIGLDWVSTHKPEQFESYKKAFYESTSWGLAQILGLHYELLGYENVYKLKHDFEESELNQLQAMMEFMRKTGSLRFLQREKFFEFARLYNGVGKVKDYAEKIMSHL